MNQLSREIQKLETENLKLKSQQEEVRTGLMRTIGTMAGVQSDLYIALEGLKARESAAVKMVKGLDKVDILLKGFQT